MRRVILLGLDGLMFEMVEQFVREGILPNFAKCLENGVFAPLLPSPPTDTPTNWTSIATGTFTGTHGVNSFGIHLPGEPWENFRRFGTDIFSRAEYVWQSAERAGKKCLLINYPGGWPPNIEKGVAIDGSGPFSSIRVRLSSPILFSSEESERGESNKLEIVPAIGFLNLPNPRALESAMLVSGKGNLVFRDGDWILEGGIGTLLLGSSLIYNILIIDSQGKGYDEVLICRNRDAKERLATLRVGEESDWLWGEFNTSFGTFKGKFKLRLLELSPDGKHIKLFRTTVFNTEGWAYPKHIADELIDDLLRRGENLNLLSEETKEDTPLICTLCRVYEPIEEQAIGLSLTARYLSNRYEWDLLFIRLHAPDGLNHEKLNELFPQWKDYDPKEAEKAWAEFRSQYAVFDRLLGDILRDCADDETLLIVASDHAALPTFRRVWLGKFFEEAGLVTYKPDPLKRPGILPEERMDTSGSPSYVIDWENSKVFLGGNPFAQNIWVNLKGREVKGIVDPKREYEEVVRQSIQLLYSIRDPETGECPISLALRKEEADFLGQWGDTVGDIVFYFKPPYTEVIGAHNFIPISEIVYNSNGFFDVKRGGGMQGIHHPFLPSAKFLGCSVGGVFIALGEGLRRDYKRIAPIRSPDVVPIICYWLRIPQPRHCEGQVPLDIFE